MFIFIRWFVNPENYKYLLARVLICGNGKNKKLAEHIKNLEN